MWVPQNPHDISAFSQLCFWANSGGGEQADICFNYPRKAKTAFLLGFDCFLELWNNLRTLFSFILTDLIVNLIFPPFVYLFFGLPFFSYLFFGLPFQFFITLWSEGAAVGINYYVSLVDLVVLALNFLPLRIMWENSIGSLSHLRVYILVNFLIYCD